MLISTKHKVQLRLTGVSSSLQVFGHEPKYWNKNVNGSIKLLEERATQGDIDVCTTFHGHPYDNGNISLNIMNVVVQEENSGDHQNH